MISSIVPIGKIIQKNLTGDYTFRPENIYQEGNAKNREIIGKIVDSLLLPGSRIENVNVFKEFYTRCKAGESCLLLAEHYSNLDFPAIFRMLENDPELGPDVARRLLPIRGMKLTETTPQTASFTHSYDNITIYPSRTLDAISDPQELAKIRKISVPINHAAMREMIHQKNRGRIILVFPAGTRYRKWKPDSRKGVREIHSYVKSFDNVIFLSINGNLLPPHPSDNMVLDKPQKDVLLLTCSAIIKGRQYKKDTEAQTPEGVDKKSAVVQRIMEDLKTLHDEAEPIRKKELALLSP